MQDIDARSTARTQYSKKWLHLSSARALLNTNLAAAADVLVLITMKDAAHCEV